MSDESLDPRWAGFDEGWRAAADVVADVDPDPTARRTVLHAVDNSDYPTALIFATASVRHSDGREAALRLAKLIVPLMGLMLDEPDAREFDTMEVAEAEAAYEEIGRRLQSVIGAHEAGRAVPPEFRADVEDWWDGLKAGGDVDAAIAQAQARLSAPPGGDTERFWLHEILLDWLYVDDQWRWQPALVLLADGGVQRAVGEMRSAAGYSFNAKAPFADTFRRYADELEATTANGAA